MNRAEWGGKPQAGETPDDRMDEDDIGDAGGKLAKMNPIELSKEEREETEKASRGNQVGPEIGSSFGESK